METDTLLDIISSQRRYFERPVELVPRILPDLDVLMESTAIIVISGIRRCGKSTLLKQIARSLPDAHYFNFDDERLVGFDVPDFERLLQAFLGIRPDTRTFLFDEIQMVPYWERFVRRLFDMGYKVFVTGSNSRLLQSEVATSMTGRNITRMLYPFSFREIVQAKGLSFGPGYSTEDQSTLRMLFMTYLEEGGFPEVVLENSSIRLPEIYRDLLIKDIIVRNGIRNQLEFRTLSKYLMSIVSCRSTFNAMARTLDGSSVPTVQSHVQAMMDAYLLILVNAYHTSFRKQVRDERKVYALDTGLARHVGFSSSPNTGLLLENAVVIECLRRAYEIFYHNGEHECDIILRRGSGTVMAIQVATHIDRPDLRSREITGLVEAMKVHDLTEGYIITDETGETIDEHGYVIHVVPAWRFLLRDDW